MTAPALEVRDIAKTFGAVRALRGVSLSLAPGEVLGLVGDNGAGKSTLVKVIAGALTPSSGEILVGGEPQAYATPLEARAAGIETVFQNLALIPTLDIAENVFLNREMTVANPLLARLRWMSKNGMRRDVEARLGELGLTLPPARTKVAALSGGQRQLVAIARAVLWGSRIVVLDEPTAALGVQQTAVVLSFIERIRERGVAVIFISHNMEHVLEVAGRIVVLRLGRKVLDARRSELDVNGLIAAITGVG